MAPIGEKRRCQINPPAINPYKHHWFPAEIISYCVRLYFRFGLSYRDVEELMAARDVILMYEAVRYWCRKFGQAYANQLCRRNPRPRDKWHLGEVFLTINGERHYLWRAVDQDGHVLDILVQCQRDKTAAKRFFRSAGHAQHFLAAYGPIASHFRPRRHLFSAPASRQEMTQRFQAWQEITSSAMAT
jgi:DDE domain